MDISIQPRLNFGRFTVMVLRSYLMVDPRVKDLVLVVKTWSKRRRINEAFQGTLNSFSLILMVIHVLQNVEPPVLPNIFLPTLPLRNATSPSPASPSSISTPSPSSHKHIYLGARKPLAAIDGVDGRRKIVSFHRDEEALRGWGAANRDPLSVLLLRFFCYYATEYDWASDCVSIVRGCVIKVGWYSGHANDIHALAPTQLCVRACFAGWARKLAELMHRRAGVGGALCIFGERIHRRLPGQFKQCCARSGCCGPKESEPRVCEGIRCAMQVRPRMVLTL